MQGVLWDEPAAVADGDGIERWAEVEPPYRWRLGRRWGKGTIGWVMLNPSTADGLEDDPTMRKVMGFSRRAGFGTSLVTNAFAYQATDPKVMLRQLSDDPEVVIGPRQTDVSLEFAKRRSDLEILKMAEQSRVVVLAWGGNCPRWRALEVVELLESTGRPLVALGYTQDGHPRHPLMLAYATEMAPFERRGELLL